MKWKDTTSYSRDKSRVPTSFSLRLTPDIVVSVVSGHIYNPGAWVMHCHPWFDTSPLGMMATEFTAEQAQEKALALLQEQVDALARALQKTRVNA